MVSAASEGSVITRSSGRLDAPHPHRDNLQRYRPIEAHVSSPPTDDTLDFLVAFHRGFFDGDDEPMQHLLTRRRPTRRCGDRPSHLRLVRDQEPRHDQPKD